MQSVCKHEERTKCDLESYPNRARVWFHAGNHVEPGGRIRNRAYFHARDSDLLLEPAQKLARFRYDSEIALPGLKSTTIAPSAGHAQRRVEGRGCQLAPCDQCGGGGRRTDSGQGSLESRVQVQRGQGIRRSEQARENHARLNFPSKVLAYLARTLKAVHQSRVTLSLRQGRLRAACCPR